jgi:hypothetical protein
MPKFEGQWKYQSYRPDPVAVTTNATPPTFVPWSPPGVVTIDAGGTTGKLEFTGTPIKLDLKIQVTDGSPGSLAISAVMKLPGDKQFTNELQGWFIPAEPGKNTPLVVRGSIVQTSADIAKTNPQPMLTTGFFVLEPLQ